MPRITINSILGGHGPATNFARPDQYRSSLGIDPSLPMGDPGALFVQATKTGASGLIRPTPSAVVSNAIGAGPMWMKTNPKTNDFYVYSANGSVFTSVPVQLQAANGFTTVNTQDFGASNQAAGCEYYDNYMYFASGTDIGRYGPLNGTAAWNPTYWTGTLGKTALNNIALPAPVIPLAGSIFTQAVYFYPNHVLHRHSDGKLYIADVDASNQGNIHFISTKRVVAEGDTDNGSTYGKLVFGTGLQPTCIESYGSQLAIALYEHGADSSSGGSKRTNAKIAFWDTNSANFNTITWVEFPDAIITAMKNINGVLYVFSGNTNLAGCRVTRFIGGYTYQEVDYFEQEYSPYAGGVDGHAQSVIFGTTTNVPETSGCIVALSGLQKSSLSHGKFNIMRSQGTSTSTYVVTSVFLFQGGRTSGEGFNMNTPLLGWSDVTTGQINGYVETGGLSYTASVWWSQVYKIGARFKITRIRIPLAQGLNANMDLTPKIYLDDGEDTFTAGAGKGLIGINTVNNFYATGTRSIVQRPVGCVGQNNFWLELRWNGLALCTVSLPIVIDYEILDD